MNVAQPNPTRLCFDLSGLAWRTMVGIKCRGVVYCTWIAVSVINARHLLYKVHFERPKKEGNVFTQLQLAVINSPPDLVFITMDMIQPIFVSSSVQNMHRCEVLCSKDSCSNCI